MSDVDEDESVLQRELGAPLVDAHERQTHQHPSAKEYIRIGIILAVLTGLEVTTAYSQIKHSILIPTLLTLSFVKFVLVVMWFMHLKTDSAILKRFFVLGLVGATLLFTIIMLTLHAMQNSYNVPTH